MFFAYLNYRIRKSSLLSEIFKTIKNIVIIAVMLWLTYVLTNHFTRDCVMTLAAYVPADAGTVNRQELIRQGAFEILGALVFINIALRYIEKVIIRIMWVLDTLIRKFEKQVMEQKK